MGKKIVALLAVCGVALTLGACSGGEPEGAKKGDAKAKETEKKTEGTKRRGDGLDDLGG